MGIMPTKKGGTAHRIRNRMSSQQKLKRFIRRTPEPPKIKPRKIKAAASYRDGGEGMIQWTEDHCYVPVYLPNSDTAVWHPIRDLPDEPNPETGRSYKAMWESQKEVLRQALVMQQSRFKYRLIVFCWPRGEGKSFLACLVQLWKFFCWPRQQIMLGANSKDQIKFVHFDIMKDIIQNSPKLMARIGSPKNLLEKEIRLKDSKGVVRSMIRSISSFSGIVSNITGFTFSEMFDMKNPKFYVQLDGSIRTMPNALGVIDSTVSAKDHVLYSLYTGFVSGNLKKVFFSYRTAPTGASEEYWNPNMTAGELNDYKIKFPFGEFERYFQNLWSAGVIRAFSDEMIEEMGYIGYNGILMNHNETYEAIEKKHKLIAVMDKNRQDGSTIALENVTKQIDEIESQFKSVESVYKLSDEFGIVEPVTITDLQNLGDVLDTDWALLAGVDLSDPMSIRGQARTILAVVAKGLPGSRSMNYLAQVTGSAPKYVYFLIFLMDNMDHSIDSLKNMLDFVNDNLDGIDVICSERYGAWDMTEWCDERRIAFEAIFPTYARQREAFKELFLAVKEGRFKAPPVPVNGSKKRDILREEMEVFNHDTDHKWFGSPEKYDRHGIQDDSIYAVGWALYAGRNLGVDDFRIRTGNYSFGALYPNKVNLGAY